MHNQCAFITL